MKLLLVHFGPISEYKRHVNKYNFNLAVQRCIAFVFRYCGVFFSFKKKISKKNDEKSECSHDAILYLNHAF